jgi:hypothetical protein
MGKMARILPEFRKAPRARRGTKLRPRGTAPQDAALDDLVDASLIRIGPINLGLAGDYYS